MKQWGQGGEAKKPTSRSVGNSRAADILKVEDPVKKTM